ncbi:peptidylprolyl isomerase [Thiohalocapsa marina]|uniref:peptidylprolyl isomerase n=1 Tax=Thiohalocapsa marina TaxID=424902 RepID=A0A5M8FQB6_9GAMM|nr:peptidyl-prolyl cis-trans isomerase [Thiohalocapsa marina]KAA6184665.1 peptidylprolyl isomerase [Thiohalocapsa marina]
MKTALPLSLMLSAALVVLPASAQETIETDQTLIGTINGQPYALDLFRIFFAQRAQGEQMNNPALQEQAFNEFLSLVVAAQEGEKRKLGDEPDVQQALQLQRMMILSNAALQQIADENPASEDELKEAYERFKEQAKRTEYKARHILVDEKAKAEDLIAKLDKSKGKDFESLAKEHSLGPTAEKGGDLGWFDARQMVKPFSDAVSAMEPGSWTEQPVQTQFGWHVILLEETRAAEPPSFEEARPTLEAAVRRQKLTEALSSLREQAKVELNEDVVVLKNDGAEATPDKD